MRKVLLGGASAAVLFLGAAGPAAVAAPPHDGGPNERACANGHGTQHAHQTVPPRNHTAHMKIPHFCGAH